MKYPRRHLFFQVVKLKQLSRLRKPQVSLIIMITRGTSWKTVLFWQFKIREVFFLLMNQYSKSFHSGPLALSKHRISKFSQGPPVIPSRARWIIFMNFIISLANGWCDGVDINIGHSYNGNTLSPEVHLMDFIIKKNMYLLIHGNYQTD